MKGKQITETQLTSIQKSYAPQFFNAITFGRVRRPHKYNDEKIKYALRTESHQPNFHIDKLNPRNNVETKL